MNASLIPSTERISPLLPGAAGAPSTHAPDAFVARRAGSIAWSRPWLRVALFALLLAAATGVLLRFGLVRGMPVWAANYGAVRHAHSHLMYFGWGTLGIMALIWGMLPQQTGRALPRGASMQMLLTSVLSLLSFPAFWANGYGVTEVFGRSLPLGSMAAAANGLPWFLFAGLYISATWRLPERSLAVQLWDWALALLLLASLGAMTLGVQVALDVESAALREASLHLFLDLFATGWFSLASLGLLWAWLGRGETGNATSGRLEPREGSAGRGVWLPTMSLALPLAVTFVLGMSPAAVPPPVFWTAAAANAIAAALFFLHLRALWGRRDRLPLLVRFGMLFLTLYLLTAVAILVPGVWRVAVGGQLRVFYLHNLLLGFMSSLLLGMALPVLRGDSDQGERVSGRERALDLLWSVGVGVMVAALLGLGLSRWVPISALFWLRLAAWSSILPPVAATLALVVSARTLDARQPRMSQ